ncbi:MAG: MBL fold metallo-hydrolase [Candidatus Electrothrix sp. AR4]|nr:MBL fold metallo-hydrolase [Candidatus Electrothrix sp. AR4]
MLLKIGGLGITAGQNCTAVGSAIPYSSLWTITPTVSEIYIYALLLLLWRLRSRIPYARKISLAGVLLLVLHFTWGLCFPSTSDSSHVSFLDVGQGMSSFLRLPDGSRILVDGGGNKKSRLNVGEQVIAPYLWKQRIWRLDQAVISHPHSDHFNGMDFILAHFKPKKLYINGGIQNKGNYNDILAQAKQQGTDIIIPEAARSIVQKNDFQLVVMGISGLSSNRYSSVSMNDTSLIVQYTHGRRTFLLPADITKKREKILLEKKTNMSADVLLAAHHGSVTSNSKPFLEAVKPSLIVVSAGKYGQRHYPSPTNLDLWQEKKISVAITREEGTITCTTDGNRLCCIGHKDRFSYSATTVSILLPSGSSK